ncbi:MAG TPA: hypothetical protein VIH71_01085 [Solirubrobacteraceae bacterium]
MTFVLVVFGAIVGALSTGGASWYAELRDRRLKRKVAARLILGDLYLAEGGADEVLRVGSWANIEWGDPIETWRESREPFAASVDAWEWTAVDNAFRILGRIGARAVREKDRNHGHLSTAARRELGFLSEQAGKARAIVLPHVGSEKERVRLTKEIERQRDGESIADARLL